MTDAPIVYIWKGGAMWPLGRFSNRAGAEFDEGSLYTLAVPSNRSKASHNHYFARIAEIWQTLPESVAMEPWAASAEHLRAYALIKTGWCQTQTHVCMGNAEARRTANVARRMVTDAHWRLVVARGKQVDVYTPQSQKVRLMGKEDFQQSKDDVLELLEKMIAS